MDVIFVLLIFFVLTTTFNRETGVEVDKPKAASAVESGQKSIQIAITREGLVYIDERQVETENLKDIVKNMLANDPSREIILIADKNSQTGKMVEVMDICNLAGAKKISVAAMAN